MRIRLAVFAAVIAATSCTSSETTQPPASSAKEPEALEVTIAPVLNPAFTLVLPGELGAGDAPPAGADCAGAYRWARGKGAYAAWGIDLTMTVTAHRYTQVAPDLLRIKRHSSPTGDDGTALLQCGNFEAGGEEGNSLNPVIEVELNHPSEGPERNDLAEYSFAHYGQNDRIFSLNPGDSRTFPISVESSRTMPRTPFTVQFLAEVNGVTQIYELQDGDQPFAFGTFPDGGGYHSAEYLWCPGSPGRLTYTPPGPSQGGSLPSCR